MKTLGLIFIALINGLNCGLTTLIIIMLGLQGFKIADPVMFMICCFISFSTPFLYTMELCDLKEITIVSTYGLLGVIYVTFMVGYPPYVAAAIGYLFILLFICIIFTKTQDRLFIAALEIGVTVIMMILLILSPVDATFEYDAIILKSNSSASLNIVNDYSSGLPYNCHSVYLEPKIESINPSLTFDKEKGLIYSEPIKEPMESKFERFTLVCNTIQRIDLGYLFVTNDTLYIPQKSNIQTQSYTIYTPYFFFFWFLAFVNLFLLSTKSQIKIP